MNSKFLYAATIAVSLISTVAMAGESQDREYGPGAYRAETTQSNVTRQQVAVELAQAKTARKALSGPDANRTYNPFGTQVLETSTLARSEVKSEVLAAAAAGTLQRTDYDDVASLNRKANQHAASATFAQRFKAKFSKNQS